MWFHGAWRARQPILLLLTYLAFNIAFSEQCIPYPITVPIHNVTLSNGDIARGAELAIGHPPQALAFLPQWPLNNTLVYGTNGYCTDSSFSADACTTWRGGRYDLLGSDTRRQPPDPNPVDGSPYPETTTYTDIFQVNDNVTLDDFAVGVPLSDWLQQGYHPMMALGLGSNSTFLASLQTGKQIASRVWSMFYGLTGASSDAQLDGALVFGGYDQAKVSGQGYTQKFQPDPRCESQLLVTIDDIIINFPNGTDVSIVEVTTNGSFPACIVPDYPGLMTLGNNPYFLLFEIFTNTSIYQRTLGEEYYTMLYTDGDTPYRGDLSINIRDGPSIRIPNNQLVVPERYVDGSTGQLMSNYSRSNLVLNSLNTVNEQDLSQLGRVFLSSAYLMVNQDNEEFTLWTANPTALEDLVGVDSAGKEATTFCTNSTSSISPVSTSSAPSDSGSPMEMENSKSLSSGAIAGIVVAAVTSLAITIGALLWRRSRSKDADTVTRAISEYQPGHTVDSQDAYKWEQQGGLPQELHGHGREVELSGETPNQMQSSAPSVQRFELGD
ncbi:aspartic peptidase domain-containing protein [Xylaria venustula]|nr:aspartic peptidase domain-containing protein [Xylaria venustula]